MRANQAIVAGLLAFGLAAAPALAGTASTQFNVTATVLNTCAVSASDMAFGSYSASSGAAAAASTNLSVTCTAALAYTIALDGGSTVGNVAARAMSDGAAHDLSYGLYTSAAYSTLWGDGTAGSSTVAGSGTGAAQSVTVYGRIPASQFVTAGNYTDRVTVTLTY